MKNTLSTISLFIGITILFSNKVYSQPPGEANTYKGNSIDSLKVLDMNDSQIQIARFEFKAAHDQVNKKESKSKTKEIKQSEREAKKAAKEFRRGVRLK